MYFFTFCDVFTSVFSFKWGLLLSMCSWFYWTCTLHPRQCRLRYRTWLLNIVELTPLNDPMLCRSACHSNLRSKLGINYMSTTQILYNNCLQILCQVYLQGSKELWCMGKHNLLSIHESGQQLRVPYCHNRCTSGCKYSYPLFLDNLHDTSVCPRDFVPSIIHCCWNNGTVKIKYSKVQP